MSRQSTIVTITFSAFLVLPCLFPAVAGLGLPLWVYGIYLLVFLICAAVFFVNYKVLVDVFLVKGKTLYFILANVALITAGFFLLKLGRNLLEDEELILQNNDGQPLDFVVRISGMTMFVVLEILSMFASILLAFSEKWKYAEFRYNEALGRERKLSEEYDALEEKMKDLATKVPSSKVEYLTVKVDLVSRRIKIADVLYIESEKDYIHIHMVLGEDLMTLMTLKSVEKALPFDAFCRVHRSFIVNVDKVAGMRDKKLLLGDEEIPLSDSYKASFFELLSHKSLSLKTV